MKDSSSSSSSSSDSSGSISVSMNGLSRGFQCPYILHVLYVGTRYVLLIKIREANAIVDVCTVYVYMYGLCSHSWNRYSFEMKPKNLKSFSNTTFFFIQKPACMYV